MFHAPTRTLVLVIVATAIASVASGCSAASQDGGAVGTTGGEPAVAAVQISSMFLTVENRAGQPLLNVRVAIRPIGVMQPFSTLIARMESGEKRDIALGNFRSNDGTPFSTRLARPRDVLLTAVDMVGKTHEMTTPWK